MHAPGDFKNKFKNRCPTVEGDIGAGGVYDRSKPAEQCLDRGRTGFPSTVTRECLQEIMV